MITLLWSSPQKKSSWEGEDRATTRGSEMKGRLPHPNAKTWAQWSADEKTAEEQAENRGSGKPEGMRAQTGQGVEILPLKGLPLDKSKDISSTVAAKEAGRERHTAWFLGRDNRKLSIYPPVLTLKVKQKVRTSLKHLRKPICKDRHKLYSPPKTLPIHCHLLCPETLLML